MMAPIIAGLVSAGLRLVANAALVKGKEFIKEKTGVDVEQASLSEADQLKLRQFQAEHEEELLRLQMEDNRLGLEETKAYLADISDARKMNAAVLTSADAPWYAKAIQPALAALIVVSTIVLFSLFVLWTGDDYSMNERQKDIVIYILGVLSAAITQILGYYFGSSQGSANKSKALDIALATRAGEQK
jgi:hypothetical protein